MWFQNKYQTPGKDYTIPQIDLSVPPEHLDESLRYLFTPSTVDEGQGYLGHPDSVLLKNGDILTFFPEGHGKGRTLSRISHNGGKTYPDTIENPPKSWETSLETPTVYRLEFTERNFADKLILICGNPKWPGVPTPGGFNVSLSSDEGKTWSEYERFYGYENKDFSCTPIVPMSSLTKLKENGKFVDKWMGLFHECVPGRRFVNYKTILTFDDAGNMHWSKPERYFKAYRGIEKNSNMCEVECVRADGGTGDELMLITRSNTKKINSLLSFSRDEGKTWSKPVEAPAALNGERHHAEWLPDGRLFITFRSIERDAQKLAKNYEKKTMHWYSEGWIAWVGTYDDLKNGREGQYRLKIAHTYLNNQTAPCITANADTGYCGNVVLPDGTVVTSSYGIFSTEQKESGTYATDKGKQVRKTYIISKRIRLEDAEKLLK